MEPAVSRERPSGLKATARTELWCASGAPMGRVVAVLQRQAVPSRLPVTMVRPSGLNAASSTAA